MQRQQSVTDHTELNDVAILTYSALRAAVLAGAHSAPIQHLLDAFKAASGDVDLRPRDLRDAAGFATAALEALANTKVPQITVMDALLDALRELETRADTCVDEPSPDDIISVA